MPIGLLLWGCETWALRKDLERRLSSFQHRAIRRILGISMLEVKEDKVRNETIRENFFRIPPIREMIAARQLSYLGKIVRHLHPDHLPKQLLVAWANNPRPAKRGILYTNKRAIVKSLDMLYTPKNMDKNPLPITNGALNRWYEDAMSEKYWEWLIDRKLRKPHLNIPPPSDNPPRNATHEDPSSPPSSSDRNSPPSPSPRRPHPQPPPTPNSPRPRNYNPDGVGANMNDSLKCMGLDLSATERELKVRFRLLSRKYHPDKHKSDETGLLDEQAKEKFQEFNNAYAYLRSRL
jgi:hypothetical protein